MIIPRMLTVHLAELGKYYPIVSLTGPRQAGKTTLLSELYPGCRHVSLKELDTREEAQRDPRSFLEKYDRRVIFDDAQRVPALFNYLQGVVDADQAIVLYTAGGKPNK